MQKVKEIYLMGGAFFVPGNVTPLAEANFHGDPLSVRVVLAKAQRVYVTPLNVTNRAIITREIANYIYSQTQNPFKSLIPAITNYYADVYAKLRPEGEGASLHDVFTLYFLINKQKILTVEKVVFISVSDDTRGLSYADFRSRAESQSSKHIIALDYNYEEFLQDFIKIMSRDLPLD